MVRARRRSPRASSAVAALLPALALVSLLPREVTFCGGRVPRASARPLPRPPPAAPRSPSGAAAAPRGAAAPGASSAARRAVGAGELPEQRLSTLRSAWAAVAGFALAAGLGLGFGLPGLLSGVGAKGGLLASFLQLNFFVPELLGGAGPLEHWLHPANMGIVLVAMGGLGSYTGWRIRQARLAGEPTADITAPLGAKHELIMALMTFFFTAGGVGGLLFTLYEGRPLFSSTHSLTGVVGLLLLYAQAALGSSMKGDESLRSAHAVLGSATMGVFVLHLFYGLVLGLTTG